MTPLREAAQQALEALEKSSPQGFYSCKCMGSQHWPHCYWKQHQDAITALKAALAEPVQEPVAQRGAMFRTHPVVELQRSVESAVRPACGVDPAAKAEPVQEPVQEPVAQAMQDAVVYGMGIFHGGKRIDPDSIYKKAEPVQEPVARVRVNSNVPGRINELDLLRPLPRGEHFLYTAPRQRKPLTDEQIERLWYPNAVIAEPGKRRVAFGRAVERAHGIGGQP